LAGVSSGAYNICGGYISCGSITSGGGNIMFGDQVGYNSTTTGSGNIYIASGTTVYNPANASHQLFIGDGGAGSIVGTGINTSATETLTLYGLTDLPNLPSSSPGGTISGVCWSSTAGELWGDTSSTICGISAIKYKNLDPESEAVQPGPALAGLDTLRTDAWHYKPEFQDHGKDVHVGLIADDVAKMDPRCGAYDDKGELYNYQDRCVTAYVIAAVKGLEARSEAQQREIWALAAACLVLLLWCAGITGVLVRRG
jgi:hypothetical protein